MANIANNAAMLHQMLSIDKELARMIHTELWEAGRQAGFMGHITDPPCCPSETGWCESAAVPWSWAIYTWLYMAKCDIGTTAMVDASVRPRVDNRHILEYCAQGVGKEVYTWPARTGVRRFSYIYDDEAPDLREGTYKDLMIWDPEPPVEEMETHTRAIEAIVCNILEVGDNTCSRRLKNQLGPWHRYVHRTMRVRLCMAQYRLEHQTHFSSRPFKSIQFVASPVPCANAMDLTFVMDRATSSFSIGSI